VPDAPVANAQRALGAVLRARPALAFAACVALCSCASSGATAHGPESAHEAHGAPPSTEARGDVASAAPGMSPPVVVDGFGEPGRSRAATPGEPDRTSAATPEEPRSPQELLQDARRDVLGLGRADVTNIKERAARVLSALSDLIHALDRNGQASAQRAELEFEAERLRRASGASFAQGDWVRLGLVAALDALEHVAPAQRRADEPLRESARQAAEGIPERSSLAFHHAAIQDAARATVDAYALSLPGANPCLAPDTRGLESTSRAANP
jgi:hypothetical protein